MLEIVVAPVMAGFVTLLRMNLGSEDRVAKHCGAASFEMPCSRKPSSVLAIAPEAFVSWALVTSLKTASGRLSDPEPQLLRLVPRAVAESEAAHSFNTVRRSRRPSSWGAIALR
jgi:hypothetical protein